ncbi:MAG: prepilin-type N-terminal cleavage/methylation domain-containing protein [Candidatus Omnitrophica bacterium]|nr:prepilin-type N-terminal cleavage/methylation domain-containing protein [Candidatus Omnitrophota bacterium]
MQKIQSGISLIEMLVTLVLLSILVLGVSSIDVFSHYHLFTADRRAKLQNEVSYLLEHMAKNLLLAIGNPALGESVVDTSSPVSGYSSALHVYVDANASGSRDTDDYWVAYGFNNSVGAVRYCGNCSGNPCTTCNIEWENISTRISSCSWNYDTSANYINVTVVSCWDLTQAKYPCNTSNNPQITMNSTIKLPSVATN